jgi:hypothetical protein
MSQVKFLLDEDSLGLAEAVERHNLFAAVFIDLISIGDAGAIAREAEDDEILVWAQEHARILITRDRSTMRHWLSAHIAAGRTSPGVFILKRRATIPEIMEHLELVTGAGRPEDFANREEWIPQ